MPEVQEQTTQAPPEADEVQSGLVDFADPVSPTDNKQATPEKVQAAIDAKVAQDAALADVAAQAAAQDHRTAAQRAEDAHVAANEAAKQDFERRVMAAREPETAPLKAQPVAPQIEAQTRAEMAAGQRMNEHHANLRANAPQRRQIIRPGVTEPTTTAVFRPGQHDEYKASFRSPAQTVSKDNLRQP